MKKLKLILFGFCLCTYFMSNAQFIFSNESFESPETIIGPDGKEQEHYGIWIDGGSDAYTVTSEKYDGAQSFVITKTPDPDKPNYASIYTVPIDLTGVSSASLDFKYLITNSPGNFDEPGSFFIEISSDGGETFQRVRTYDLADETIIKSTKAAFVSECEAGCKDVFPLGGVPLTLCKADCADTYLIMANRDYIDDLLKDYWSTKTVTLPSSMFSNMTVIRIQSDFLDVNKPTKLYLDELKMLTNGQPELSADTVVASSDPKNTKTVVDEDFQGFSSLADWGIWQDGGRNVYITDYLAVNDNGDLGGFGIGMRNFFSGRSNGVVNGVDLGFQKPTYSSIVTKNLDLTGIQDLDLSFSFVAYNMKITDDHVVDKAQVPDIKGVPVDVYVEGPDYVNISISTDSGYTFKHLRRLTYGVDFLNLVRQDININIPGNILSTDDNSGDPILNTNALTTTTQIKIQCFSDTDDQQFYVDNIKLTKYGTNSSPKGTPRDLNWESYEQTYLYADPTFLNGDTYELINSKLLAPDVYESRSFLNSDSDVVEEDGEIIPGTFGVVEFSDCSDHSTLTDIPWTENQRHIDQSLDPELGKYIFNFHSHLDEDTERCRTIKYADRMRCEIKTKEDSGDDKKGLEGETHFYAWKMKLPSDFLGSNKFTHLHQIKPVAGDHAGMPTITLTANGKKVDPDTGVEYANPELRLRYAGLSDSQVTVDVIDLNLLKGKWIQFVEKVHFGISDEGRYELLVYDPINGSVDNPIFTFESYSLQTWKSAGLSGDENDPDCFVRPKWGIYRSNAEPEKLGDEIIGFADFTILEVTDKEDGLYGDLTKFAEYAEGLEGTGEEVTSLVFEPDPTKVYTIDSESGYRLSASGSSETAEAVSISTTGKEVQWQFVPNGDNWHIQLYDPNGEFSLPRIRAQKNTDPIADMQSTGSTGGWTQYTIVGNISSPGYFFLTIPGAPTTNKRLQLNDSGEVSLTTTAVSDESVSFKFTEITPESELFEPDPTLAYIIESESGYRLSASGSSETAEAISASENAIGSTVEWKFVQKGDKWLLQLYDFAGEFSLPRIRANRNTNPIADMESTSSSGRWTQFTIEPNLASPGYYFLTIPGAPTGNQRLQLKHNGDVTLTTTDVVDTSVSFTFTKVAVSPTLVTIGEVALTENGDYTNIGTAELDDSEIFLYHHLSITDIPEDYHGAEIVVANEDSFTVHPNDNGYHYFLAPTQFNTSGFPEGHPAHNNTNVSWVGDGGSYNYYDYSLGADPTPTKIPASVYKFEHTDDITYLKEAYHTSHIMRRGLSDTNMFDEPVLKLLVTGGLLSINRIDKDQDQPLNFFSVFFANMETMDIAVNPTNTNIDVTVELEKNDQLVVAAKNLDDAKDFIGNNTALNINPKTHPEPIGTLGNEDFVDEPSHVKADFNGNNKVEVYEKFIVDINPTSGLDNVTFVGPMVSGNVGIEFPHIVQENKTNYNCEICKDYDVATPLILGFSNDEVKPGAKVYEERFEHYPKKNDNTYANCLSAIPYATYKTNQETQVIIPKWSNNDFVIWSEGSEYDNCTVDLKDIRIYNNLNSYLIVGLPNGAPDMPSEYGWEKLMEKHAPTDQVIINSYRLFKLKITVDNQLVQFIPAEALVWGASSEYNILTIEEYVGATGAKTIHSSNAQNNTSSIPHNSSSDIMQLYPNPTDSTVTLKLSKATPAQVAIYDVQGIKIDQLDYTKDHTTNGLEIDLNSYSKGLYIIKASQDNDTYVQKISKQ